ncbi:MAG: hypothetical protein C0424_05640 [Sphingobacteriaceae bacterium]|nr:hypothetical protein [Sphingobacteriaceae bacterium]
MQVAESPNKPLVEGTFVLEKFPGKGGWTYAALPAEVQPGKGPFGWLVVQGKIDELAFDHYKLMPMGNGRLFLPVKAAWRKQLRKSAGDEVNIVLYADDRLTEVPADFLLCLADEPTALQHFNRLPESSKQAIMAEIYQLKSEKVRVERMATVIQRLGNRQRWMPKSSEG